MSHDCKSWLCSVQPKVLNFKIFNQHTAVKRKNLTPLPVSSPPETLQEFERKTCATSVRKCSKSSTVRENYKQGVSEDVH